MNNTPGLRQAMRIGEKFFPVMFSIASLQPIGDFFHSFSFRILGVRLFYYLKREKFIDCCSPAHRNDERQHPSSLHLFCPVILLFGQLKKFILYNI